METTTTLQAVRAIIADEAMWCKHNYTPRGLDGIADASQPCCIEGAFMRVLGERSPAVLFLDPAYKRVNKLAADDLPHFNDSHSHSEVLALLDEAIGGDEEPRGTTPGCPGFRGTC